MRLLSQVLFSSRPALYLLLLMTEFTNKKEWDELIKDYPKNRHRLWEIFYNYVKENEKEIWESVWNNLVDVKDVPYNKK